MPSSRPDSFERLEKDVVSCRACPRLRSWCEEAAATAPRRFRGQDYWRLPIPGFGSHRAWLWIVGLAPAAHGGNRTGRVFTGDSSGDFLFSCLYEAGLANQPESTNRQDGLDLPGVYISPAVRCAPPANRPAPEEFRRCAPFLSRELSLLLPGLAVILPLGALAWASTQKTLGAAGFVLPAPRPAFAHGAEFSIRKGDGACPLSVLGSYHVSRQNTNTSRLTREMFGRVLGRAKALNSSEMLIR
ncbi:MAG: uracil-DNA glycosylase [Acidobacteria bacterium]|nr:uracil-DNA glycosylase [Acidobacteriota bacterium]MCG3191838.1 Type-5 uracil-DNA glycosylase [Thermoanaerobaculia bacterium]MCK6685762.1 uracil-DNA glycosylase [Thermoanaerobaculia bacterium]